MEGRIGNHGNQEESKEGQQEETLNWPKATTKGTRKRPLSFFAAQFNFVVPPQSRSVPELASQFSGKAGDRRRNCIEIRTSDQIVPPRSSERSPSPLLSPLPAEFRCA